MHPHWQATDSDETPSVSVDSMSATPTQEAVIRKPATVRTASRKPAAALGILLVLGMGYASMGGSFALLGQVAGAKATVTLTADGPDPETLTVSPGATVEWKNKDAIPHILSFENLTSGGKPLETSPIFPDATVTMLVPKTTKAGSYDYISKTSDLSGTIVIAAEQAQSPSSKAASAPAGTVTSAASSLAVSSTPAAQLPVGALIPVNKHTVGSPNQKPVEPLHTGAPVRPVTQHKPVANTASGPANWVLIGITTLVVLFATRRAFR